MRRNYPDTFRRVPLLGLVVLSVTAGCLAPTGSKIDNSQAVGKHVENRYESLDGFQATMIRTVERGGTRNTTRATVAFDKGRYLRIGYETGPHAGSATVVEDPSAAKVLGAGEAAPGRGDSAQVYGAVAASIVRQNDVVYQGLSRVEGHRVAVYSLRPQTNRSETGAHLLERRVSVDLARQVPIRLRSTWAVDGQNVTETIRFTNIKLSAPRRQASGAQQGVAP
ncbi:MAG: outer membrane lipoprotein carrier protein LolA [Halorientalis sp.]